MQLTRMQQGPRREGRRPTATAGAFPIEVRIDPDNNESFVSLDGHVLPDLLTIEYKAGLVNDELVQTLHLHFRDGPNSRIALEDLDRLHEIDEAKTPFHLEVHMVEPEEEPDAAG